MIIQWKKRRRKPRILNSVHVFLSSKNKNMNKKKATTVTTIQIAKNQSEWTNFVLSLLHKQFRFISRSKPNEYESLFIIIIWVQNAIFFSIQIGFNLKDNLCIEVEFHSIRYCLSLWKWKRRKKIDNNKNNKIKNVFIYVCNEHMFI